jgi:hypothetical protein
MKRRNFGKLAGSSMLALSFATARAQLAGAQTAPPSSLGAGLTPMGAETAANADGSIPAWTGGLTSVPAGIDIVTRGEASYVPELFPNEQPLLVIDQNNMAAHAAQLSEGVMAMMTKYGFKIEVYPTHRTAAAPQWVYDNIAKNHGTAGFTAQDSTGGRFGFENAYGGVPFPVPDTSNPLTAGAQIVWNHNTKWWCEANIIANQSWSVSDGQQSMAFADIDHYKYPYYNPNGPEAGYDGAIYKCVSPYTGPENLVGQNIIIWAFINPYQNPQEVWELLNGQGRVRRAPEASFDTPASQTNGIANYDEYYGFNGSLERYDWTYIGKQEMYVPYNNNRLYGAAPQQALLQHFLDPSLVRWEKHRCWVVEAKLHPGEGNVLAKRRLYVDEDTWAICMVDAWDGHDNLYKVNLVYNNCRPDLPNVIFGNNTVHNLQTDNYVTVLGPWNESKTPTLQFMAYNQAPDTSFDPANMAASAQY